MKIDPGMTVAEIAKLYPATLAVLQRHKIDLCCGGIHSLRLVAEKHGFNLDLLLRELNEALTARAP